MAAGDLVRLSTGPYTMEGHLGPFFANRFGAWLISIVQSITGSLFAWSSTSIEDHRWAHLTPMSSPNCRSVAAVFFLQAYPALHASIDRWIVVSVSNSPLRSIRRSIILVFKEQLAWVALCTSCPQRAEIDRSMANDLGVPGDERGARRPIVKRNRHSPRFSLKQYSPASASS